MQKEDFSEEDGVLASELEAEFAELNGWEAESDASKLIQGLGLSEEILYSQMSTLDGNEKVKVLLAQALSAIRISFFWTSLLTIWTLTLLSGLRTFWLNISVLS